MIALCSNYYTTDNSLALFLTAKTGCRQPTVVYFLLSRLSLLHSHFTQQQICFLYFFVYLAFANKLCHLLPIMSVPIDLPKDGDWFTETGVMNSGHVNVSMKINSLIDKRKSKFQDILVFKKLVHFTCNQ